jgi:hypothetical protein
MRPSSLWLVASGLMVGCNCDPNAGVAAGLNGLRWEIPCGTVSGGVACPTVDPAPVSATLGGAAGAAYDVTLRFRGVVEQKTYLGGASDGGLWQVGGTPATDTYNIYQLTVSAPQQVFYLNRGTSSITRTWLLDYQETVRMNTGAIVTLTAQAIDAQEIRNLDDQSVPLVVPDIPPAPQAFDGQFIQMDVLTVATAP